MAAGVGEARPLPRGRRQPAREALRADDVPLPERRPAHGSRRGDRAARRDRALLVAARLRGAQPDRLGLLRPARGERRDPAQRAPGDVHLRQHRDPGRVVQEVRRLLRLVPPAAHLRPGVLPLDAVAVPEAARARPGLPQVQPGELVPQRPDRAGQRAGRRRVLRALRRRGDQARADPVVLQGHRLRPAAAGRHGRACDLARAGADAAAQLDRPLRGRARRLRGEHRRAAHAPVDASTRPARTRCSVRRSWWSPPTRSWPRRSSATSSGRRSRTTWRETRKASDIDRMSTERPKTGVFLGAHAVNPVNGERCRCGPPTTCWPTTAPARSWRCPAQDQRDWDFADGLRPADRAHGAAARGLGGRGVRRRRPGDQLRQRHGLAGRHGRRRGEAHDHRLPGGAGDRPRCGQLPAARLAAVAAAVLGLPDPGRSTARPTARSTYRRTSCPSCCRS